MLLKDKVIMITGASKGLGSSIAETCSEQGAKVVLLARSLDKLNKVKADIELKNGVALALKCDVSQMKDLENAVNETLKFFGHIDGLVNNAGINFVKPFLEVNEQDWDDIMDVDLKGSFFLTQLCAKQMVKQKSGSIVQIASVHTLASLPGAAPYDAAKRGMIGYSKAVAVELAKENVRVNVLSPGLCHTKIWDDIVNAAPSEEECLKFWNANIPAERLIEPVEIANSCVFLLSDMSSCVTGANLLADCGMTSQLISKEPYKSKGIKGE